jgi:hypothetical protein
MAAIGERQGTVGEGRDPSGQEGWLCSGYGGVLGAVISFGSWQISNFIIIYNFFRFLIFSAA